MEDNQDNSQEIIHKTARKIIEFLLENPNYPKKKFTAVKAKIGKQMGFKNVIKDATILEKATNSERAIIQSLLRRRNTRSLSGVTVVAVMTSPDPGGEKSCPGECIFCPGNDSQPGKKVARSYTGREPAAMRSAMYDYDSYQQTFYRLRDLEAIGHNVDKIELIIMGGTFLYSPPLYQEKFMKGCFDAILDYKSGFRLEDERTPDISTAKQKLETSDIRMIGVTFETRPDYCTPEYIDRMLQLGATRVEIGIQTTDEEILEAVHRNHTLQQSIDAIRFAKDAGLKINLHIMPNLPGSTPESDLQMMKGLFTDPRFRPDMMKLYPCLVIEGTELYEHYRQKRYIPYSLNEIVQIIGDLKNYLPPYVRIQRIQRDIPAYLIIAGVQSSNLRQIVQNDMKKRNLTCKCIRCREEGFYRLSGRSRTSQEMEQVTFNEISYEASEGREYFLSFENFDKGYLVGYLRLRIPSETEIREEIPNKSAIIREIRVVGEIVLHYDNPEEHQIQHRGYGKKLIKAAEKIAYELGMEKVVAIAGIGVRPYFYKQNYIPDGPYVSKIL